MSSNAVFSIPELFEAILLQLPLQDILHFQQVCGHWKDTITKSPSLRHRLFLDPITQKTREPELNPLLQKLFPQFFRLTPLPSPSRLINDSADFQSIYEEAWYKHEGRRATVLRADASWRRMYPVQPASRIKKISERGWCCLGLPEEERAVIRDTFQHMQESGATMGFLYDIVVSLLDAYAQGGIFIQWQLFPLSSEVSDAEDSLPDENYTEKITLENSITIHNAYYGTCTHPEFEVSGLKIIEIDPNIIQPIDYYGKVLDDGIIEARRAYRYEESRTRASASWQRQKRGGRLRGRGRGRGFDGARGRGL